LKVGSRQLTDRRRKKPWKGKFRGFFIENEHWKVDRIFAVDLIKFHLFNCSNAPFFTEGEKLVPEAGLEPARVSPYAPQAYVSAISPPGLPKQGRIPSRGKEAVLYFPSSDCQFRPGFAAFLHPKDLSGFLAKKFSPVNFVNHSPAIPLGNG
jgi:hypothetical protein